MPTPQNASAWKPVDESNQWTPVQDSAPPAATSSPAPQTMLQKVLGVNPVMDTLSSVGTHLKNLVAAPYHAFTDDPRNPDEQKLMDEHGGTDNPILNVMNRAGLGAHRMLVQPTVNAVKESNELRKAGGPQSSMWAPSSYDAQGNNIPTAGSKLIDAIPLVGPWSRGYADEVHQKGVLPATAGLATDVLGPKAIAKVGSAALPATAKGLVATALRLRAPDRAFGATPEQFVLDHTTGNQPEAVVSSARDSLKRVQAQQEQVLGSAPGEVPITPTRGIADDYHDRAMNENHPGTVKDISKLGKQLAYRLDEGGNFDDTKPIPDYIRPADAAALNRGIASAKTSWNPATASDTMNAAAGEMHHQLAANIAEVVPEIKPLNQTIQSGLPIVRRGNAASLNADMTQRTIGRVAAHTGALTGMFEGFRHGGVVGGAAGLILPELLANPDVQIGAARAANRLAPVAKASAAPITAIANIQPKRKQ